jgi:plastocyanin
MRHLTSLVISALLAAAAGCGGAGTDPGYGSGGPPGGNPPPGNPSPNSVTITNNTFDPASVTVSVGQSVTWTWNACSSDGYGGNMCTDHNVTFDDGVASSTKSEGSWSRNFAKAGTYPYHCSVHGSYMSGAVVVR